MRLHGLFGEANKSPSTQTVLGEELRTNVSDTERRYSVAPCKASNGEDSVCRFGGMYAVHTRSRNNLHRLIHTWLRSVRCCVNVQDKHVTLFSMLNSYGV